MSTKLAWNSRSNVPHLVKLSVLDDCDVTGEYERGISARTTYHFNGIPLPMSSEPVRCHAPLALTLFHLLGWNWTSSPKKWFERGIDIARLTVYRGAHTNSGLMSIAFYFTSDRFQNPSLAGSVAAHSTEPTRLSPGLCKSVLGPSHVLGLIENPGHAR